MTITIFQPDTNAHGRKARRGLSTLEMVLSLPILLFVMALMINFGVASSWKVRTLSVARHEAFGNRRPRSTDHSPIAAYWPDSGNEGSHGAGHVPELYNAYVDHPVARGPILPRPQEAPTVVDRDLFDPTRGLFEGTTEITRSFPLLAKIGRYQLNADVPILDDTWEHQRMGIHNSHRRTEILYELPPDSTSEERMLMQSYTDAVVSLYYASFWDALRPLDRDPEFIHYRIRFGWGSSAPNFHPHLRMFRSRLRSVARPPVDELIDRIQGRPTERDADGNITSPRVPCLAERMTNSYINLYESVIRELENLITAEPDSPDVPGMRAEIAELEQKIDTLTEFRTELQQDG